MQSRPGGQGLMLKLTAIEGAAAGAPVCNRCGFGVNPRAWGCKNPCANCGTVYPLGDCSD